LRCSARGRISRILKTRRIVDCGITLKMPGLPGLSDRVKCGRPGPVPVPVRNRHHAAKCLSRLKFVRGCFFPYRRKDVIGCWYNNLRDAVSALGGKADVPFCAAMSAFDQSGHCPLAGLSPLSPEVESLPAMQTAPAVTPAVTTPATATAQSPPAVTPAASSPLHVRHVIEAGGGSRRKREDRCRLASSGPTGKN
jgi:hypothetical protein